MMVVENLLIVLTRPYFLGGLHCGGTLSFPWFFMEFSCNHLVICYCSIQSSFTASNKNKRQPSPTMQQGSWWITKPYSAQSATFQLKSITFVPYILASSSDSYDPKTSVAKFLLPRSPHFFGISSTPPNLRPHGPAKTSPQIWASHPDPPWPPRQGSWTPGWRPCEKQPEMIPWSGWHFFDQKGVGWIQSPAMWKLYNLYKFCLFFWMVVYYHGCKWFLWKCLLVESTLEIFD